MFMLKGIKGDCCVGPSSFSGWNLLTSSVRWAAASARALAR